MKQFSFFLTLVLLFLSCGTSKSPYLANPAGNILETPLTDKDINHRVYLIGDAGGFNQKEPNENYVFNFAKKAIAQDDEDKTVVFLGDNIYESGLGPKNSHDRKREEKILDAHISFSKLDNTQVYVIPGNHDWNNNRAGGLAAIQRQEDYIKQNSPGKKVKMYPKNGCGDPKAVRVDKDLVYIFIDSQWWVHDWSKEEDINDGCEVKSRREFIDRLKNLVIEHKNDKVLLFLHHPMLSNGNHGGKFSFAEHVFPLSKMNPYALIPLPIIGSIYPISRQLGISNQDNSHHLIKQFHKEMEATIRGYDASRVMFISGHDHFLQHAQEQFIFHKFPIHYIISGSGYKQSYASRGYNANFVHSTRGYGVLTFYEDEETYLEFYAVSKDGKNEKLVYRNKIYDSKPGKKDFYYRVPEKDRKEQVTEAPNPSFGKSNTYRFLLGDQYREAWTTPIASEVFHLDKFYGGLTPTKKGGGLFSRTMRLENVDGRDYVMRSMNKDFYKAVPKNLQHLELLKLYADQNTASIPYGALYIAALSEYANVYHTKPEIVFLENQDELGPFKPYFPKGHYLLEARPDGDWSNTDLFGGSSEVVGYTDLLDILRKKTTHFVDQRWVLKSRLFDIFIHDRDRHDDQWRWAAFEEGQNTIYRPVPRDRDWAFFKYGGVVPWVMGNIVDKKLKSFKADCIDVKSLATNANNFDRYFLNELTWQDWEQEIDALTASMTDEAIEQSLLSLPKESQEYLKGELVEKLKGRREILKRDVKKYYDFMTKEVEVTGSDEKDDFEITFLENGDVHVVGYKDSDKHGKVKKYDRVLRANETKEIRIYGLAGKDDFDINFAGKSDIRVRIIGGIGDDDIETAGDIKPRHSVAIYDSPTGMEVNNIGFFDDKRDNDLQTNSYNRRGFLYDTGLPWLTLGYAPDDGMIYGIGFNTIKHGWRKSPYESSHLFNMTVTPNQGYGLDLEYEGELVDAISKGWGLAPEVFIETPDYINYFGLGDENDLIRNESSFNWVRRSSWGAKANLIARRANNKIRFTIGPAYESHDLNPEEGSILLSRSEFTAADFDRTHFVGLESELRIHTLDRLNNPNRGFLIDAFAKHQLNLTNKDNIVHLGGSVAFFIPLSVKYDVVFGSNSGYQHLFGEALFYQLPSMGSKDYLRPFRRDRFRGKSIAYQQFDLRFKLFTWNNSVLPFTMGGIGGYDVGQSYYKGEDNGGLKHGWTAGAYFDLFDFFILRTSFSRSVEGTYFIFDVGFHF